MIIETFVLTPFQQNTRVLACGRTGMAICVDPGEKSDSIVRFIESNGYSLQVIALTHGHLDHIGGTLALKSSFPDAKVILHSADEPLYYGLPQQPVMMGLQPEQLKALGLDYENPPRLTRSWVHGEVLAIGDLQFKVLHCPGHTPGHVVLAEEGERKAFVGDCLFAGSIGRTDLPGGSHDQLIASINDNILSLGDDFEIYSGHGPETTVGREKATNPFLTGGYSIGRGKYI